MEYTVIGDTREPGRAARVERQAGPDPDQPAARTQRCATLVDVRPLGPIRVKGKEEEVEVYEVLGLTADVR